MARITDEQYLELMEQPDSAVTQADLWAYAEARGIPRNLANRSWNTLAKGSHKYFSAIAFVLNNPVELPEHAAAASTEYMKKAYYIGNRDAAWGKGNLWLAPHVMSLNALSLATRNDMLQYLDVYGPATEQFVRGFMNDLEILAASVEVEPVEA